MFFVFLEKIDIKVEQNYKSNLNCNLLIKKIFKKKKEGDLVSESVEPEPKPQPNHKAQ